MNDLVKIKGNIAFTTTLIIAEGVGIEHRSVIRLISTHFDDIKSLAVSGFEMMILPAKFKPISYYELSELQATFLITLMKNSKTVVKFKKSLSIDFFKMRNELSRIASHQNNEQWLEARASGKIDRRLETDKIKLFVEYATNQGSKSASKYYMSISKMENKALFLIEQKYKNLSEVLDTNDLLVIQQADQIVAKALNDGMDQNLDYHDVYKLAHDRVTESVFDEICNNVWVLP